MWVVTCLNYLHNTKQLCSAVLRLEYMNTVQYYAVVYNIESLLADEAEAHATSGDQLFSASLPPVVPYCQGRLKLELGVPRWNLTVFRG